MTDAKEPTGVERIVAVYGRTDAMALADLVEFGEQSAEIVRRGRTAYDEDVVLQLAAQMVQTRIGEAAGRLSEQFQSDHPHLRLAQMKAARNFVVRRYHRADPSIVWNTIAVEFPKDLAEIDRLLAP